MYAFKLLKSLLAASCDFDNNKGFPYTLPSKNGLLHCLFVGL